MSEALEVQYRRLLAWYPRDWRTKNEDAALGTLLDVAESEGRSNPTGLERASIAAHGLSARLDRFIVPTVRDAGSTIALSLGTGVAVSEFVMSSWAPWGTHAGASGWWPRTSGPFYDSGFLFAGLWLIALIAAFTGHWALGRIALLVAIATAVVTPHIFTSYPGLTSVDPATLALLAACALVAVIGRPHRGLSPVGASAGWALIAVSIYLTAPAANGGWQSSRTLWDQVGTVWYSAVGVLIAAIGFAIARRWLVTFTLILGLAPLALTLVINDLRQDLIESGSVALIAVPDCLGLVLLILYSSGYLKLPSRRRGRRMTFETTLAVILLAGTLTATATVFNRPEGSPPPAAISAPSPISGAAAVSTLPTVPPAPRPAAAPTESIDYLITSGHLTSIDFDPKTGNVTSFSGQDLQADESSQQALTDAVTSPTAKRQLLAYVSGHSTTATIDSRTGKVTRVVFTK